MRFVPLFIKVLDALTFITEGGNRILSMSAFSDSVLEDSTNKNAAKLDCIICLCANICLKKDRWSEAISFAAFFDICVATGEG